MKDEEPIRADSARCAAEWKDNDLVVSRIVALLDEAIQLDPVAMTELCGTRVQCNNDLANHPTIQVGELEPESGQAVVGMIGILNGIGGIRDDGWGRVAVDFEDGMAIGARDLGRDVE